MGFLKAGLPQFGGKFLRPGPSSTQNQEQMGDKEKALENYTEFVELWRNCDPEYRPIVEDAKVRIAQMEDI